MALLIKCRRCGKTRLALDPHRVALEDIGRAVRQAANERLEVALGEAGEIGCDCPPTVSEKTRPRWNIRQLFLITTVVGLLVAVFRHPLSLVMGAHAWKAAAAPWRIYGWLFFGTDLPLARDISGGPVHLILFCVNVVLAVLAGYAACHLAVVLFGKAWLWATGSKAIPESDNDD